MSIGHVLRCSWGRLFDGGNLCELPHRPDKLGVERLLQAAGKGADVYLDSLNPLISALRVDYLLNFLLNFLQTVAAKV